MYAQDSIDLLQNSGIQFKKHEEDGIDPLDFAALLMTSGVVLMDNIKWLSFHRCGLNFCLKRDFFSNIFSNNIKMCQHFFPWLVCMCIITS